MNGEAFAFFRWMEFTTAREDHHGWQCEGCRDEWERLQRFADLCSNGL